MIKKVTILSLTILLPCFLVLETWEVFRYRNLQDRIEKLDDEQNEWLDKNKKVIMDIAAFGSPERIDKIARNELKLDPMKESQLVKIDFVDKGGGF
jgi:cell division protein FtsL